MLLRKPLSIRSDICSKIGSIEKTFADTWLHAFQMPENYQITMAIASTIFCSSANSIPSEYAISRVGTMIAEKHHFVEDTKPKDSYDRIFSLIQEGLQKRSITTNTDMTTSLLLVAVDNTNIVHYSNAGYCKALLWNKGSLYGITSNSRIEQEMSLPLGMIDPIKLSITKPEIEYTQIHLKKGNAIIVLSPGIIEKQPMPQNMKKILQENKDTKVICHRIIETYQALLSEKRESEAESADSTEIMVGCIYAS
ncbi:MAG TPA: SpoIIE family protein phosphatase [Caldisericia bacterium]|nr:SpoIIE family protein phosphatase [Caldisericia bacterium]